MKGSVIFSETVYFPSGIKEPVLYHSLLVLSSTLFSLAIARDTLTPADPLPDGETLVSAGDKFTLGFFTPPGSTNRYVGLWYNEVSVLTVVMVLNRQNPIKSSTGVLTIASNGSLVISDDNSTVIWSTAATNLANPVAQLLETGNLVVGEAESTVNPDKAA
ncbi:hypothetical protein J5N97_011876 [Dioscorea zingiberensis]|uniref:Bulb-type lectin domain-containing protein n=1 Tax=Dioscorea zingiberensis TaxID=325984 RepID=A0A9D5D1W7_9LILI|nr:hypothetical protein J5N97_011876 [Dioscorea zingiberensis]